MNKINDDILPENQDVTQKVLDGMEFSKSMEDDIESVESELDDRTIDFEEFERFIDERLTMVSSWNSRAESTANELVEGDASFEEAFGIIDIPADKDRMAISHGESAKLNQVLSNSQLLVGQLVVMLKICLDSLEYAEEAIDIQRSQRMQKETIKILKDNMGDIMANAARESVRGAVVDAVDEVRSSERLKKEISEVKARLDEVESGGFDEEKIVGIVEDEVDLDSKISGSVDLAEVVRNSDIEERRDLADVLLEKTELSNSQIADILGVTDQSVSKWANR